MKVPYASALLKDDAAIWWRNHTEVADDNNETRIATWSAFKLAMVEQFKPVNSKKAAQDKLAVLQQKKSVQEYATAFRALLLEIPGIQEDEKIDHFIRGLKENIRLEVELQEPNSLSKTIRIADRYDSIAFRYSKKVEEPLKKSRPPYLGPAPMDLDAGKKKDAGVKKSPTCYFYREVGHVVKDCSIKKRLQPEKSNPTIKKKTSIKI